MLVSEPAPADLFAGLTSARGILLGLSGGPDSVAALALLADWKKRGASPAIFAATFDHGFRSASRGEAEHCAQLCAQLGIAHTILTWEGDKPTSRIQEAARDARYEALIAHAKDKGADHLITAHHADDQMETILFRLLRGSAIGGLAGMRALTPREGITHARPLLALRKAQLVAMCEMRGLAYVSDPSNDDTRFARTQMRRLAHLMEEAGMGPEAFARLGGRAARAEEALREGAAQCGAQAITQQDPDQTLIDATVLKQVPAELILRLFMAEIGRIGQPPRLEQAEPLVAGFTAALAAGQAFRATLGGTLIDLKGDSALVIAREPLRRAGL